MTHTSIERFQTDQGKWLLLDLQPDSTLHGLSQQMNHLCDIADEIQAGVMVCQLPTGECLSKGVTPGIQDVNRWERVLRRMERSSAISVVLANGTLQGAMSEVFLATDYRIVTPDFKLCFQGRGGSCWPGMSMYRLVQQIGVAQSRSLLLGITEIGAQRAHELGLVHILASEPQVALSKTIERLFELAGEAFAVNRQLILEASTVAFEEALGTHLAACDKQLRSIQHSSGVQHVTVLSSD